MPAPVSAEPLPDNENYSPAARYGPSVRSRLAVAALGLAVLVAIGSAAAIAGSCRVLVAIGSVDMEPSPAGMSLRLSGSWEFDNIVQVVSGLSFNVLLVRENNFVRFHYPDQASSGFVTGLAEQVDAGIDGNDILAVEAAGSNEPTARFVSLEAQRMKLSSPVLPGEGPISVVAYLVLDGDYVSPIISNTITRPLEMLPPVGNSEEDPGEPGGSGPIGDPPPPTTIPPPPPTTIPPPTTTTLSPATTTTTIEPATDPVPDEPAPDPSPEEPAPSEVRP